MNTILIIFILVYIVMAFGQFPGIKVDRTGAAVIGMMALIAFNKISPDAAWNAIDYNTVGLLFGLMCVSAAFWVAGFYEQSARLIGTLKVKPAQLLAVLIVSSGFLSALLTNDVVVIAMVPMLISITLARQLNPVPFLLGFGFAANVGSAATIIGSPQNMIAAQVLGLSFNTFTRLSILPVLFGLVVIWLVLVYVYRNKWQLPETVQPVYKNTESLPFNLLETLKATVVTLGVILAFVFTKTPHVTIAMMAAGVLLINRRISSKDIINRIDGDLLLLFTGLCTVNAAFATTGLPQHLLNSLKDYGIDLQEPLSMLIAISVLSNIVGNNPAVMLVAPFIKSAQQTDALGAAIALGTGFSSNGVVFGSLVGIILTEQSQSRGIRISFTEFSIVGVPIALISLSIAAAWILWLGTAGY